MALNGKVSTLIEQQVLDLSHALLAKGLKVATSESCTGGGLAYWLTHLAGSSAWLERGFVTYSNEAKIELLGVNPQSLTQYGAVSEQVAREMAEGVLRHSHADLSVSITGIAGPAGGSLEKPVGTVWFGLARRHQPTWTSKQLFIGDRSEIRVHAIEYALKSMLNYLSHCEPSSQG